MKALRHLVAWITLLAMPLQAMAAPGWLCVAAGHHGVAVASPGSAERHAAGDEGRHRGHDHGVSVAHAGHDAVHGGSVASSSSPAHDGPALDGETPRAGKCGACNGCSGSAAVLPGASSVPILKLAIDRPAYLPPAPSLGVGSSLFRPPRTLTA